MWKYVSRRVKDTLERTSNVLDVGRTTFCSSSSVNGEKSPSSNAISSFGDEKDPVGDECKKVVQLYRKRRGCMSWFGDRSRFSSQNNAQSDDEEKAGRKRERERLNHQDVSHSWVHAITWSSAIVCGWYTSQYLCLRRRRLGWSPAMEMRQNSHSCVYGNVLMTTTRSLHSNITSRIALAAPPSPPPSSYSASGHGSIADLLQDVNNPLDREISSKEALNNETSTKSARTRSGSRSSSLDSAVAEFSVTIGEIEYQFGVQSLLAEDYKSAVNHLKLATTHHHPAATFNLGLCYERGLGVERDMNMAMNCYTVAATQGHAKAMYNLGVFYVRGWGGLKRSRKAARECFDSAARMGQKEAQLAMEMERNRQMRQESEFGAEPQLMNAVNDVAFGVRAF